VGRISSINIQEVYELLFGMDKEALVKIANDDNMPIFIQIMADGLTKKNRCISSLELMLDRTHGKPKQKIESDLLPITNVTLTLKLNGRDQPKLGNIASVPKELSEPQAH
jgi:hypothetical protein